MASLNATRLPSQKPKYRGRFSSYVIEWSPGRFISWMGVVEGETLEDVLVRGTASSRTFSASRQQEFAAIVAAHALGLIHMRSSKPGNFP